MAVTKGAPINTERNPLRLVLFMLSIALCVLSVYLMLDYQSSSQAKLSGELILGQVDTVTFDHQGSPVLSFLFEYVGAMSYFLALMIAYLGYYLIWRPVDIWHADFYRAGLRVLGFDLVLIGLCALCSTFWELDATGAGGLLGDMLIMLSLTFVPVLVSTFIYAFITFCGLTLLLGKSPFYVFDAIGALVFKAVPKSKKAEAASHAKESAPQKSEPTFDSFGSAAGISEVRAEDRPLAQDDPVTGGVQMSFSALDDELMEQDKQAQEQKEDQPKANDFMDEAMRQAMAPQSSQENVKSEDQSEVKSDASSFFEQVMAKAPPMAPAAPQAAKTEVASQGATPSKETVAAPAAAAAAPADFASNFVGSWNANDQAELNTQAPAFIDPEEDVHTKIIRGPDPRMVKPEAEPAQAATAPYGEVHTIVQRTITPAMAAEMEARRREQEEAERRAKEQAEAARLAREQAEREAKLEAERLAQEQAEREAKLEAERLAQEQAEREAKLEAERLAQEQAEREAQLEAERLAQEQAEREAQLEAERLAQEQAEREAQLEAERLAQEQAEREAQLEAERKAQEQAEREAQALAAQAQVMLETAPEEETPIYAGTYAAKLAREQQKYQAAQHEASGDASTAKDSGPQYITPGVQVPSYAPAPNDEQAQQRPHTIIRDTRKEFEAAQAAKLAAAAAPMYSAMSAEPVSAPEPTPAPVYQPEAVEHDFSSGFAFNDARESGAAILGRDSVAKSHSDLIKELSSLASEFKDTAASSFGDYDQDSAESSAHTNVECQDLAQSDEDNDFYRFAVARSNDNQAPKGTVEVDLVGNGDEDNAAYDAQEAEPVAAEVETESDLGADTTKPDAKEEIAAQVAEPAQHQEGFSFAEIAKAKAQEQGLSEQEALTVAPHPEGGESAVSENIIDFANFGRTNPSYEVDHLSTAFIPAEDDDVERGVIAGADLSSVVAADEPEPEHEAEDEEAALPEDDASSNEAATAQTGSEPTASYGNQMNPMGMASGMYQNMPGQQMQYMQLPNGQLVPVMAPNMMGMAQGMMPNMALGMMPNMGMNQMQYMQLPNGQLVPVMNQAMGQMMNQGMVYPGMGQMQGQMQGAMPGQVPGQMPGQVPSQMGMMPNMGMAQQAAPEVAPASLAPQEEEPEVPAEPQEQVTAHTMGAHGPSAVGLPTAGNAFMGAHNSSSTNLPSYMAGIASDTLSADVNSSLSLCTVPRHHYDDWRPGLELLARSNHKVEISYEELDKTAERINNVLHSYGIKAQVADYLTGPVITRFDLDLEPGVKSSAISSIETELCRNLLVPNVRVVPIIEGSSYVGLEVPNPRRQFITLGDMASSREFLDSKASLPMCLGASVIGEPVVKDLAESPHLLVAGTTGSGKSAGLNTMLISLLLKRSPAELRLILVDPKQLEFSIYKDLPHLITPVITDVAEKTPIALRWCVDEMERRFKLMSLLGVRKLAEYNELIKSKKAQGASIPDPLWTLDMGPKPQALEPLPWIVVVVEEFADLMAQSGRKKDRENTPESLIARLSAKSRAAGIHLVLVTQTPRSEVVTGMIKANFPSRVAFTVQNRIDSTIVLDEKGAECLLGNGDMLYKFTGSSTATRAHGAFTSNSDVMAVVNAWRSYAGAPEYLEDVIAVPEEPSEEADPSDKPKELDVKFDQAVQVVRDYMDSRNKPPTVTDLQTELGVGYPRAKKIFKQLSSEGILD